MTRVPPFSSPLLVGFETIEKSLERIAKNADGYPPYNVEKLQRDGVDMLRITLAVAGFSIDDLDILTEDGQLLIRGRQAEDTPREFLHRGIASRQFQKAFVLADGMRVLGAELKNGLLAVDLDRPKSEKSTRKIAITENS